VEAGPQNRLEARLKISSTAKAEAEGATEAATAAGSGLSVRLLGPFAVERAGEQLALGGARQRALLALLCIHSGEVLSADRIVDELWGESPPATARHMVEVYVSRLRKLLGSDLLRTRAPGYVLDLDAECLDARRFEVLLERGAEALADGEAELAEALLREGLGLWRGEALADFSYEPFAQVEIGRLTELRHGAEEELVEAELALGRSHGLVADIERLVAEQPLRERRHGQLMLALYRGGRQGDALAAYRRAREILVEELGIEPGPELQRLEREILNQDETLLGGGVGSGRSADHDESPRRRKPMLIVAAVCIVAAVSAAVSLPTLGGEDPSPTRAPSRSVRLSPNSVVIIDPDTAKLVGDVPVGQTPGPIDVGSDSVWVGNYEDKTLSRIDLRTHDVETLGIPTRPYGLAFGSGAVWVTQQGGESTPGSVSRRDLLSGRLDVIGLGQGDPFGQDDLPRGAPTLVSRSMPVIVHDGSVWIGRRYLSQVVKLDASSHEVLKRIDGPDPADLAAAHGAIWVVDVFENTVLRVDERTGEITARVPVGEAPCCIAATNEAIWVVSGRTQVWVVSPRSNSVEATIDVGEIPVAIDAGEGAVWVANYGDSSVSRIDAQTYQVTTIKLSRRPVDIAAGGGAVWVSINQ
jgi:DNA-binding SARP family transcriptional activator/DNA-binding beta-propeller fold protein YncE